MMQWIEQTEHTSSRNPELMTERFGWVAWAFMLALTAVAIGLVLTF